MLKSIYLHLDDDEEKQSVVESESASLIQTRLQRNINAFQRYIPSIHTSIINSKTVKSSVFCNLHGQVNIVDYGKGRTFYGLNPSDEILQQCLAYRNRPIKIDFDGAKAAVEENSPFPASIQVFAVFGIGLGEHIAWLLDNCSIDHLVIYEPDFDYFKCSLSSVDWSSILRKAQSDGTGIYFQLEKDGRDFYANIAELKQNIPVEQLYVYKHYNHPIFNQLFSALNSIPWREMRHWACREYETNTLLNYVPPWTLSLESEQWSSSLLDDRRFSRNLEALNRFFPEVYESFKSFSPQCWDAVANNAGKVNLRHKETGAYFYSNDPKSDCETSFSGFSKRPNKDGLILGYHGKKLRNYEHYQMVVKCDESLKKVEDFHGALPSDIKSMIVFGVGIGYQLETLTTSHSTQNLFLCEPNRDFFFASLYAIDWCQLLETLDERKARLYLNIGDDGSHLVEDLLRQFHTVGPYILANTFFYQGYYNAELVEAVGRLREQLQAIIAMGDYYDHAKYGITHTRRSIENLTPFLHKNSSEFLTDEQKDVPVFIVGNGPSLDGLIDVIKENRDQAIIISCGTALQTLHRHNIVPDFHSEIETNRSTFDWASRIEDLEYLKKVSLLSCNGIHPDACGLYKDCFLALKEGESSTVSFTELFPEHHWNTLSFAYPTVANFAIDMVNQWDCRQIYLLGIDLGFVDPDYHHSKTSGYYNESGNPRYDYGEDNDTTLRIPGNFRPVVNTKFEFKVSKNVLEQSISPRADVYNLNDGAKIFGATPLRAENVLVVTSHSQKQAAISTIKSSCFHTIDADDFIERFESRYQQEVLVSELEVFLEHVGHDVTSRDDAEEYIERLRSILVESFKREKSLLFFLFNSTLNYINSALTKALNVENDAEMLRVFKELQGHWQDTCDRIFVQLRDDIDSVDFISSFLGDRRKAYFPMMQNRHGFSFVNLSHQKNEVFKDTLTLFNVNQDGNNGQLKYNIIFGNGNVEDDIRLCRVVVDKQQLDVARNTQKPSETIVYMPGDYNLSTESVSCHDINRMKAAVFAVTGSDSLRLVLPKLILDKSRQSVNEYYNLSDFKEMFAYDAEHFVALSSRLLKEEEKLFMNGDRCNYISQLNEEHLILQEMSVERQQDKKEQLIKKFKSLRGS